MFYDHLVTKKAQWRNKSSPTTIQHRELFLGKDISGCHASQEGEKHGKKPGGPGALLLWHSGNWTPRLWPTITGAYPILLMKLTCAHLNVYMHIASIVSTCPAQNPCLWLSQVFSPMCFVFTDVIFFQHLPGITRVSNILKVLCWVHTGIFYQNLLTPRMLKYSITLALQGILILED